MVEEVRPIHLFTEHILKVFIQEIYCGFDFFIDLFAQKQTAKTCNQLYATKNAIDQYYFSNYIIYLTTPILVLKW